MKLSPGKINQLSLPFSFLWGFQGSSTPGNMTGCAWHCDLPCKSTQSNISKQHTVLQNGSGQIPRSKIRVLTNTVCSSCLIMSWTSGSH